MQHVSCRSGCSPPGSSSSSRTGSSAAGALFGRFRASSEPSSKSHEIFAKSLERNLERVAFGYEHHVEPGRKSRPLLAKHLAHQALDPVAFVRPADLPSNGDAQACRPQCTRAWERRDLARRRIRNPGRGRGTVRNERTRRPLSVAPRTPRSGGCGFFRPDAGPARTLGVGEVAANAVAPAASSAADYLEPVLTVRRLRPLRRRAERTLRPFFVAMRARKPWVRLRRVLCGW